MAFAQADNDGSESYPFHHSGQVHLNNGFLFFSVKYDIELDIHIFADE